LLDETRVDPIWDAGNWRQKTYQKQRAAATMEERQQEQGESLAE